MEEEISSQREQYREFNPILTNNNTSEKAKKEISTEQGDQKPQDEIKQKKSNKWTQIKTVTRSKESFLPGIKIVGGIIAQKVTTGETSTKHKVNAEHANYEIIDIWAKHYFGEDSLGSARNIGRKDILANKEDLLAAQKLLEECKKKLADQVYIEPDAAPSFSETDGICAGIRLDIAERHLLMGESIGSIIEENKKGASSEAAANQAVYELLRAYPESSDVKMTSALNSLIAISKSQGGNAAFHTDFNIVGQALVLADDREGENFPVLESQYTPINKNKSELLDVIKDVIEAEKQKASQLKDQTGSTEGSWMALRPLGPLGKQIYIIKDPTAFRQAVVSQLNENFSENIIGKNGLVVDQLIHQREKNMRVLNWTTGLLQYKLSLESSPWETAQNTIESGEKKHENKLWNSLQKQASSLFSKKTQQTSSAFDAITDPQIRYAVQSLYHERMDTTTYHAVAYLRGLKLTSVDKVMGHYSMHPSDASYLSNIPKLPPGVYSVDFDKNPGSHSITYVKVSDQEGYILDPNGFQIKCKDGRNTILQFQKLLAQYPEPKKRGPIYQEGQPDHHLAIQKFDPIRRQK
jgi:hypothetical protein